MCTIFLNVQDKFTHFAELNWEFLEKSVNSAAFELPKKRKITLTLLKVDKTIAILEHKNNSKRKKKAIKKPKKSQMWLQDIDKKRMKNSTEKKEQ